MTVETLVHGPKEFKVTLTYAERAEPITQAFYTLIEREAFVKGIELASWFMGKPGVRYD